MEQTKRYFWQDLNEADCAICAISSTKKTFGQYNQMFSLFRKPERQSKQAADE